MTQKTTSGGMTMDRFKAILEAYGANEQRWPESERAAVAAFAAKPEAAALLADARALDLMLDDAPEVQVSTNLASRILEQAPRPAVSPSVGTVEPRSWADRATDVLNLLWPRTGIARPAGLITASLMVGFMVGFSGAGGPAVAETQSDDVFAYVFGAPLESDWDWGELE